MFLFIRIEWFNAFSRTACLTYSLRTLLHANSGS